MKITIIHGSTRRDQALSFSKVYADYIIERNPNITFSMHHVGRDIKVIENDKERFSSIIKDVEQSDGVIWIIPVYVFLVPAQVKRFIEMIFENEVQISFKGKYAAVLTTSIQIMDHLSINYLHAICDDLEMKYVDSFSSTALPLVDDQYKANLRFFFRDFLDHIEGGLPTARSHSPTTEHSIVYEPSVIEDREKTKKRKVTIITDLAEDDGNLRAMIDTYKKLSRFHVDVVDLHQSSYSFCIGCLRCTRSYNCGIHDGFQEMYEKEIVPADVVLLAASIRDRFLSSKIKGFFDREFFTGHTPALQGKQGGFIISGRLRDNANVTEWLTCAFEIRGASVTGFVTDEYRDSSCITRLLKNLENKLANSAENGVNKPKTYRSVGTTRIIRDLVYIMRYPFSADYDYFKKTFFKTFPHRRTKAIVLSRVFYFFSLLTKDKDKFFVNYTRKRNESFRSLFEDQR